MRLEVKVDSSLYDQILLCIIKDRTGLHATKMLEYANTQSRIVIWTLAGVLFLVLIALLSCFCSNIRRHHYDVIPTGSVNNIAQNYYDSFRQFQEFIISFDELQLGVQLGKGSYGTVYSGRFRGSRVAVKRMELPLHLKEGSETFVTEVLTLSKLRNRNIVQLIGISIENDKPCIIMEYMKGGSVATIIHRNMRILQPKTFLKWALDAATGMEFLHSHKPMPIIHRDLKSDNLLVDENELVKVGDFGTAKLIGKITKVKKRFSRKKRKRGENKEEFPGTTAWAAPEVLPPKHPKTAQEYTTAADVYSFGITLWEMVSNRRPFTGYRFEFEIMDDVISGVRPQIPNECPTEIAQIIEKCWHPDLKNRPTFPTIHMWLENLRKRVNMAEILKGDGRRGSSLPARTGSTTNIV